MINICGRTNCGIEFKSPRAKKYCSPACGRLQSAIDIRAKMNHQLEEDPDAIEYFELMTMKAFKQVSGPLILPFRVRQAIAKMSKEGIGVKPIGKRLGVGPDLVSEWQKANPMECEPIPEVEIYDDLFQTYCERCELETYMWVLHETHDCLHLYCPDCQHNQYLIHPREESNHGCEAHR